MSKVLVIGDLHAPATDPSYFSFVSRINKKYKCDRVVFIGDIIDHEAISFHAKNPELPAALDEYNLALKIVKKYHKAFPVATVCIGNHDERIARGARTGGIPEMYLKEFNDVYGTHGWSWEYEKEIDNVLYTHGTGWSGKTPAFNAACYRLQSVVAGHHHSVSSINWIRGPKTMLFGMNVGSGVDNDHLALNYGKHFHKKPITSCGVVINGHPFLEIKQERTHK